MFGGVHFEFTQFTPSTRETQSSAKIKYATDSKQRWLFLRVLAISRYFLGGHSQNRLCFWSIKILGILFFEGGGGGGGGAECEVDYKNRGYNLLLT